MGRLLTLINGRRCGAVPASDRGLLYGDGLFETIAVRSRRPCLWMRHLARLQRGCERLAIPLCDADLLGAEAHALLADAPAAEGVLKLIITRGSGPRGYAPPPDTQPTRILAFAPAPALSAEDAEDGVLLTLCETQLGENARLAGIKHLNRLEQVLGRAEWTDPGIRDGIMCNARGHAICCTAANLYGVIRGAIVTPSLHRCGIAGTVREVVREEARALDIPFIERELPLAELLGADGLFISNALLGALPVARVQHRCYDPSAVPAALLDRVQQAAFQPETPA